MNKLHPLGNTLLRTAATFARYHNNPKRHALECFMCRVTGHRSYRYWRVIANEFPYDAVAEDHMLLVPRRHIANREDLSTWEKKDLDNIMRDLDKIKLWDAVMENTARGRTQHQHYHLHLLKWKRATEPIGMPEEKLKEMLAIQL